MNLDEEQVQNIEKNMLVYKSIQFVKDYYKNVR